MKLIGNAIVGQSGGPTAAINATLVGVLRGARCARADGTIEKIYGMRNGVEGLLREDLIDLTSFIDNKDDEKTLTNTPAAALGSCRKKLSPVGEDSEQYEKIISIFKKYNIRYFFYIGGNDSMDTVAKLSKYTNECGYEMRLIGVPKTIDNDLYVTDHTPGFGSAAKYIATMTQEILRDCAVYTVKAVTIIEIMGRDTGWLTAASAIGRSVTGYAPDYIYLPETNFDDEKFISDVKKALEVHPNVVIAVSEGVHYADGRELGAINSTVDVFGHKQLAGSAKTLEALVKEKIGCKVRSIELNLCQRCASHIASLTDINESLAVGEAAVKAAVGGVSRVMMIFRRSDENGYSSTVEYASIDDIANKIKYVPKEYINEEENNITDEFIEYLKPLISGEVDIEYVGGLPKHYIF